MADFDLSRVGLSGIVTLKGVATVLLYEPGGPIIFQFDEHHSLPPIQDNIASADAIASAVPVGVVGVESHPLPFPATAGNAINRFPDFANHFLAKKAKVFGVEFEEVFREMEGDLGILWASAKTHPHNFLRSVYYVAGLARLRREHKLTDHIFLNCGKKHGDHLESIIRGGLFHELAGEKVTYVRIRPDSYPASDD